MDAIPPNALIVYSIVAIVLGIFLYRAGKNLGRFIVILSDIIKKIQTGKE